MKKQNKFNKIKNMNLNQFTKWLINIQNYDFGPWMEWFDENYCKKCEAIKCKYPDSKYEFEAAYCELADNGVKRCRFFPDMNDVPNSKETCLMWLKEEKK